MSSEKNGNIRHEHRRTIRRLPGVRVHGRLRARDRRARAYLQSVICWGLVVELVAALEGDLRVVGDDFMLTWVLEKKNIIQPDSGQILETHAGLFRPGGWEI